MIIHYHIINFMLIYIINSHSYIFFFFNDTATTEIYTLSLHDALPIFSGRIPTPRSTTGGERPCSRDSSTVTPIWQLSSRAVSTDRKSTRLNSSHSQISYAVFCLKKKII